MLRQHPQNGNEYIQCNVGHTQRLQNTEKASETDEGENVAVSCVSWRPIDEGMNIDDSDSG